MNLIDLFIIGAIVHFCILGLYLVRYIENEVDKHLGLYIFHFLEDEVDEYLYNKEQERKRNKK